MLLSLFRSTMIVSLLISAVCIEVNSEKFSLLSAEKSKAVARASPGNNDFFEEDPKSVENQDEDSSVQKRESGKEHESRTHVGSIENRVPRSNGLAHKMAKDALKSPKMQETMKKLTRVGSHRRKSFEAAKTPAGGPKSTKNQRKQVKRKGRRKKKRKRHHRRYRNEHPASPKRGSAKRTSESRRDINESAKKLAGKENSQVKRNQAVHVDGQRKRPSVSKANDKIAAVKVDDSDYVDFSTPLSTEPSALFTKTRKDEGSAKLDESESMVERLMRTTTKDPTKKSAGDQGIEYSDYYSDADVLQDIAANKIPINVGQSRNSNDRFTRQIINSTSFYTDNQFDGNVEPDYPDYETRGKNFRFADDSVNSVHNFQNQIFNRRSRLRGADDSSLDNTAIYKPLDDRIESTDVAYPVDAGETSWPDQPEVLDQASVPDFRNNLDASDPNDAIQTPDLGEAQSPDQFNYGNRYEGPREEQYKSFETNEPRNMNFNQDVDPQMEIVQTSQNENPQVPQFSNQFGVPEMQRVENFDQSVISSPQIGNTKEDIDARLRYDLPVQVKNNYYDHSSNVPSLNVPNAMDQPLGKVLESLGINVNPDSSSLSQNLRLDENAGPSGAPEKISSPASSSETHDRPVEHIISPSYAKKKSREESSKDEEIDSARGSDRQGLKSEHEGDSSRGHSRRHSAQSRLQDDNFLPYTDQDTYPAHNMNISIAVHDTKEVANQILDTIMEELEELKLDRAKSDNREVSEPASPRFHESLLNGTWNVSGHAPFRRGSPFSLIATDNGTSSIAVFVGACRVCQGIDTIAGVWSVARQPKDCRDFQVATSVVNDIFRKTKWSSLKEKPIGTAANKTDSTTPKNEKKRS